jgi:hypothetical protein
MFVAALVVPARAAHSRGMRLRDLAVLVAVLGCSAGAAEDAAPGRPGERQAIWGGQTGSLSPKCGLSVQEAVPEGASGIVVDTRACVGIPTDADVQLTTESGEAIEAEWIPLGGGRYLVRPTQSLDRGQYQVSVAGASQSLQIGASSPKPTRLGVLEQLEPSDCDLSVDLRLDEAVIPFASLLRVDAMLDGERHVLADYGALTAANTVLPVRCANCVSRGQHSLVAVGEIAGEPGTLVTETLTVNSTCSGEAGFPQDSGSDCGFARTPGSGAGGIWGGMALGMLALLRRARAKKSGGS